MKRINRTHLAWPAFLLAVFVGAAQATPQPNGASLELRTFNDCPSSTVSTSNSFPSSIVITDAMDPGCIGFANLHSWSFSEDAGVSAAVFNNNSNFRFGADFKLDGAGTGEGGLRLSPWYGKFVDGRFMANATSGEVACFGGTLPFYSFTGNHGVVYVKGTTIHLEVRTYLADDLFDTDPAHIQYRVIYNNVTYDSPVLEFGEANATECDPRHLWGILNDARAGAYFQASASTGASLSARWSNITYAALPAGGTPMPDGAFISERTYDDCPSSTLTTTNNYPALVSFTDVMDPGCFGFANLHNWSFSDDGGTTAAAYHNNSNFHFFSDFKIEGAGEGEGGLRISPWYGKFADGRFMANATSGEIACFGGALPFYSFTGNHAISYVKGTSIHLDVTYRANELVEAEPASIRYRVIYNGNTYDSPELPFGEANAGECDPYHTWGMLNDGRVGSYFQVRANTGSSLTGSWTNTRYSTCTDPVQVGFEFRPRKFNLGGKGKFVTATLTPSSPHNAREIDIASIRLNGVPVADGARVRYLSKCGHDRDDDDDDDKDDHGRRHGDDWRRKKHCRSQLVVKFDRAAVGATLAAGSSVPVLISGLVGNDCFEETVRIRVKTGRMGPHDNQVLAPGSVTDLQWDPSDIEDPSSLSLLSSVDNGANWIVRDSRIPNSGTYRWTVPNAVGSMRLAIGVAEVTDDGIVTDVEAAETGTFTIGSPTGVGDRADVAFALGSIAPNPARRSFNVAFSLPTSDPATLGVYDVTGRQVILRDVGALGAGSHRVGVGDRVALKPGIYLIRLTQLGRSLTTRAIVIQ